MKILLSSVTSKIHLDNFFQAFSYCQSVDAEAEAVTSSLNCKAIFIFYILNYYFLILGLPFDFCFNVSINT